MWVTSAKIAATSKECSAKVTEMRTPEEVGPIPKHDDIMKGTIRGTASGDGCKCLINTLRQLIAASKPTTRSKEIRNALRLRFNSGPDVVTASNYLTFDVHWRGVVELLEKNPDDYKITCTDLDFLGHGEVVGNYGDRGHEGIISLYIAGENGNHFVSLHKKRFSRLSS